MWLSRPRVPGAAGDGADTCELVGHTGADDSPWPNPAHHLYLLYWITATPFHLLIVDGRSYATIAEGSRCDRHHKARKASSIDSVPLLSCQPPVHTMVFLNLEIASVPE